MHLAKEIDANIMGSELVKSWGTTVTTASFERMMNKIVNPFGAKAIIKRVKLKKPLSMKVSGYFWSIKRGHKIVIHYHLDHTRTHIHLHTRLMNRLVFLTSQTLQHELIHQDQERRLGDDFYSKRVPVVYSKRIGKKREDNIKYLSTNEEIDCYGQNIAMELVYNHPGETITQLFKNIETKKSQCYKKYKIGLKNTDWKPVQKALLKKIWKWLPKVIAPPRVNAP